MVSASLRRGRDKKSAWLECLKGEGLGILCWRRKGGGISARMAGDWSGSANPLRVSGGGTYARLLGDVAVEIWGGVRIRLHGAPGWGWFGDWGAGQVRGRVCAGGGWGGADGGNGQMSRGMRHGLRAVGTVQVRERISLRMREPRATPAAERAKYQRVWTAAEGL